MKKQLGKHSVFVAGAGGIGPAVALLLREPPEEFLKEAPDFEVDIYLGDIEKQKAESAREWLLEGSNRPGLIEAVEMPKDGTNETLSSALEKCDLVLDCVPGEAAPRIARLALKYNCHYANLTEYTSETEEIIGDVNKAKAKKGFILQTGLAPGFINILAHSLFKEFRDEWGVDKVDSITMKVGALTENAFSPHYYGFTWSPIGVATEYLEPAIVIRDFEKKMIPSLSARTSIVLNGVTYEEDLTSGGAADLPDALSGNTKSLDYKTLRHAGHYGWIDGLTNALPEGASKAKLLQAIMEENIPRVERDFVLIYASVQGKDKGNKLRIKERVCDVRPKVIGGKTLRAIQATTAAPLAECAVMLLNGKYKGVVLQSQIDTTEFLQGAFVSSVYGDSKA
jgi:Saccharopine dehydrogenase and related proteins